MYYYKVNWYEKLLEHMRFVRKRLGDDYYIVCVSCKGSQNYNLADENSDFDSVCLVVPKLHTLMNNLQPLSTTYMFENGEQCKVKDLRVFCKEVIKSWSMWEVFTTEYVSWAPQAEDFKNFMRSHLDDFAYANEHTVARAMLGEATREYNNTHNELFDEAKRNKARMKVLRFNLMMNKFQHKVSARKVLTCDEREREFLLAVKHGQMENAEKALDELALMYSLCGDDNKERAAELYDMMMAECSKVFKYFLNKD